MPHVIKENNATFNFLSANQQQTGILKTIVQKSSSCLPLMTETVRLFLWVDPPVDTQKCIMSGILSSTYWLVTVVSLWMEQHEWDASVLLIEFGSDVISALRTNTSHHKALAALPAKAWKVEGWVAQSCPTLCDPMDYTVHGILQTRILEWVAIPFSRGSSQPKDQT